MRSALETHERHAQAHMAEGFIVRRLHGLVIPDLPILVPQ